MDQMAAVDFKELIQDARAKNGKRQFKGTFLDYLELVREDPGIAKLAHARIYDMITSPGFRVLNKEENPKIRRLFRNEIVKSYKFFEDEFFGMERVLAKIIRYFRSASLKGEESRQVLYLVGPVGSGKSSLIERIKEGLIRTEPFYVLEGCPMHEEPLHLLPHHLRGQMEKILNVSIEGDLCPVCRYRLREEFQNQYENFPVVTAEFSKRARRGIGVVPPVDPNNQDTSVLIGSEDISKLDKYPEHDPRVLSLNGAFNAGNRGIVEFIEVFKNEIEYLHIMITATQEKTIPSPGKQNMIYFDGVILAHSNEAEWNKFKADHTNEAILDRIVKIEVPYVLELSEEIKIYEKILRKSKFDAHIAPHTIEIAAMFAILTRLHETNKCDLMTKLKIYNGEEVVEKGQSKKIDVEELREEDPNEGMSGISTRFILKSLDNALSDSETNCINPINVREALITKLKESSFPEDLRKKYLSFLQDTIHKEYLEILEKEITKAFVHSYEEQAEAIFSNYLDHAEAYVNKTKLKDPTTKEELEPDLDFLKSIEEQIGITGTAADGFRQDVTSFMFSVVRRGGGIDYKSYEPLKEAIEKKLTSSVRELSRVVTKAKTRDKKQQQKYSAMANEMIRNGYCEHCCDVVLSYASHHLWKD
jgi:serine protein kinase